MLPVMVTVEYRLRLTQTLVFRRMKHAVIQETGRLLVGKLGPYQGLSGWERGDLLAACLDNADCIFEVLDHRRSEDLFEQLSLCHTRAREFSNDCAVHALDRWVHAQPSVEDISRLNVLPYFRVHVGQYLAASEVCWGVGSCPLDEIGGAACQEKRTELRSNEQLCRGFR